MKISAFKKSFSELSNTNRTLAFVSGGLIAVVLMQQFKINSMHERLVIVTPNMTQEAVVSWDGGNQAYYSQWALFLVSQISSVVPVTVDYNVATLAPYFEREVWNALKPSLLAIKEDPSFNSVNPVSQFTPTGSVIYEPETKTYFVSGRLVSSAYKNGVLVPVGGIQATYEFKFKMNNGLPLVTEFYSYEGAPKTLAWAKNHREQYEQEQQRRKETNELLKNRPNPPASSVKEVDNTQPLPVNDAVNSLEQMQNEASGIGLQNGLREPQGTAEDRANSQKEAEEAQQRLREAGLTLE